MTHYFPILIVLAATALLTACGPGRLPAQKIGKPYVINGQSYYPSYETDYDKTGTASWYGPGFHGKYTASGEVYDQNDYTAAHPTLPMPSLVRVTNIENGKSQIVRINDRGPFAGNRLIDLSKKTARDLDIHGLAQVRVQFLEAETQQYLAMVKENGGTIIPMAEFHRRAETFAADQPQTAMPAEVNKTDSDEVAAPTMTVAQDEIESQQPSPVPITIVQSTTVNGEKPVTPRLFVNDAMADEVEAPQTTLTVKANPVVEASPAAGEAPPASVMAESIGKYTIQAGAFSSESNAKKLVEKLRAIGDAAVDRITVGGKMLWRVRVGGFATPDYAEEALAEVRAQVPDAKIVKK